MKPRRKQFVRNVTALVDADPTFVSIVSTGAIGSPFNVVKQEELPNMKIKPRKLAAPKVVAKKTPTIQEVVRKNANNRVGKGAATLSAAARVITKFFYAKDTFEDEAAVRAHLDKSDFEGAYTVTEEDDRFVVVNTDAPDASRIAKSAEVEADDGVLAEVAILNADGEESEEDDAEDEEDDAEDDDAEEEGEEEEDDDAEDLTKAAATDDEEADDAADTAAADKGKKKPAASKKAAFLQSLEEEAAAAAVETPEQALQKFDFWSIYDSASSDFLTLLKDGCEDGLAPGFEDVMWTFGRSIRNTLSTDDEGADAETILQKNSTDFVTVVMGMHNLFANIVNADMDVVKKADEAKADGLVKWAKSFGKSLVDKTERDGSAPVVVNVVKTAESTADTTSLAKLIKDAVAPALEQIATLGTAVDKLSSRRQVSKGIDPADATTSEGDKKPTATQTKKTAEATAATKAATDRLVKTVFAAPAR